MHGTREENTFPTQSSAMVPPQVPCASSRVRPYGEEASRVWSHVLNRQAWARWGWIPPGPHPLGPRGLLSSLTELKAVPSRTPSRRPGEGNAMGVPVAGCFQLQVPVGGLHSAQTIRPPFTSQESVQGLAQETPNPTGKAALAVLHPIVWPYWLGPRASVLTVTGSCSPDLPPTPMSTEKQGQLSVSFHLYSPSSLQPERAHF